MEKIIKVESISEIQYIQRLATKTQKDVYIHSLDNSIMVDAKSFLNLFTIDFTKPVKIVTEDEFILSQF